MLELNRKFDTYNSHEGLKILSPKANFENIVVVEDIAGYYYTISNKNVLNAIYYLEKKLNDKANINIYFSFLLKLEGAFFGNEMHKALIKRLLLPSGLTFLYEYRDKVVQKISAYNSKRPNVIIWSKSIINYWVDHNAEFLVKFYNNDLKISSISFKTVNIEEVEQLVRLITDNKIKELPREAAFSLIKLASKNLLLHAENKANHFPVSQSITLDFMKIPSAMLNITIKYFINEDIFVVKFDWSRDYDFDVMPIITASYCFAWAPATIPTFYQK